MADFLTCMVSDQTSELSYLASLIREDLADGVMAWDTPEGTSLTREDIRDLCKASSPRRKKTWV